MKLSLSSITFSLLLWKSAIAENHTSTPDVDICFFSTQAMLNAQRLDPPLKTLTICPNTNITIGIPADFTFENWVNGDFPLSVLHDDVTIQCGQEGKSSDNCVLYGGWMQIITTVNNPFAFPGTKVSTHNLTIRGLTFSGSLTSLPGFASALAGLGAPGTNMVFDDIIIDNLQTDIGVYLNRDSLTTAEDMPSMSSDVTIQNSVVRDSTYRIGMFQTVEQTIHLDNLVLQDISYETCGCNTSSAIYVRDGEMSLKDSTFDNVEFLTSMVFVSGNETKFVHEGNMNTSELLIYDQENRDPSTYCEGGLAYNSDYDGIFDTCTNLFPIPGVPTAAPTESPTAAPTAEVPDDDEMSAAPGHVTTSFVLAVAAVLNVLSL